MLHNHQGNLYRLTMLVVLFILLVSMAPTQPALAHGARAPLQTADIYEPDNTRGEAKTITPGVTQTHLIDPWSDIDHVKFTLSSTSGVMLEASTSSGYNQRIALYDANGFQLAVATTPARITRTCASNPLPSGTYYLAVQDYSQYPPYLAYSYNLSLSVTPCNSNIIVNPGFESGTTGWTQYSLVGEQIITTTRPHTGSYSARLCRYLSCDEYVQQKITVPSNGVLTYWWYMSTSERSTYSNDYFWVRLYTTGGSLIKTLRYYTNISIYPRNVWTQDTVSLSAYAGQTVLLRFEAGTDSSLLSTFFVDDVSVR